MSRALRVEGDLEQSRLLHALPTAERNGSGPRGTLPHGSERPSLPPPIFRASAHANARIRLDGLPSKFDASWLNANQLQNDVRTQKPAKTLSPNARESSTQNSRLRKEPRRK